MQDLQSALSKRCKELFDVDVEVHISRSEPMYGDLSTNVALQIGQKTNTSPLEIAEKIVSGLEVSFVESFSVAGAGFINMSIDPRWAFEQCSEDSYKKIGKNKTVVCEFPSPNIAKPFSVGHLRSAVQGWALSQLLKKCGYLVITDNHIGDYGTPYGKWVVGFLRYSNHRKLEQRGIEELADVYIKITDDLKREKELGKSTLKDEVQLWLKKLQEGDKQALEYRDLFNSISLDHIHEVMNKLNIATDYELPESFYVDEGQEITNKLLEKGIAKLSDGAVIVELKDAGIDTPAILRKANGAPLYATTDLATVAYREKNWHPEHVYIHTGQEQKFYFEQLNALSEKAGFKPVIVHIWHGLIDQVDENGERSKMSSRKGVVGLDELIKEATTRATKEMSEQASSQDAEQVALGAIKFADFLAERKKGMLFDWNKSFSLHGMSGPAVQYAGVRIKSILRKVDTKDLTIDSGYDMGPERQLLLQMMWYPIVVREISRTYEMHRLANYLYGLAQEFNRYYENTPIDGAEDQQKGARVAVIEQALKILEDGLNTLGIQIPERM